VAIAQSHVPAFPLAPRQAATAEESGISTFAFHKRLRLPAARHLYAFIAQNKNLLCEGRR
jgi:hypothetical protein